MVPSLMSLLVSYVLYMIMSSLLYLLVSSLLYLLVSSLLCLLVSSLLCLQVSSFLCLQVIQGLLQKYKMRNVEPNLFYLTLEATVRGRSEAVTKTQLAIIVNAVSPGRGDPFLACCDTVWHNPSSRARLSQ